MDKIIEMITIDVILEALGMIGILGTMVYLFLGGGLSVLIELYGANICG